MNKDLSPAERLAQWYYSLNYEQLSDDRKDLINDIVADLFEAAQHRMHLTAFGVIPAALLIGLVVGWCCCLAFNGGN